MTGTLHENQCIFLIASLSVLLRLRNVSEEKALEKIETHVLCLITFFNCAVYEITWKNTIARLAKDDNTAHEYFAVST